MSTIAHTDVRDRSRPMTAEEKKVILPPQPVHFREWYDFTSTAHSRDHRRAVIHGVSEATRNVFALLAFAAGFIVRPFGALVFGMLGDLIGRKYTFLMTILIMGMSTFLVGSAAQLLQLGCRRPIILIALRMAQGLALGASTAVRPSVWRSTLLPTSAATSQLSSRRRPR